MKKSILQTSSPRIVARRLGRLAVCVLLPLLLATMACKEDESYHYPPVKLEFFTMQPDAEGRPLTIRTDDGVLRSVVEYTSAKRTENSAALRVVGHYEETAPTADGTAAVKLYTWSAVTAPLPRVEADFEKGVKRDPADLLSAWMGWDYLNLLLTVKGQDAKHAFHFVEEAVNHDPATGIRSVTLSLYHDAANDVQAYTKRAYLSVPLRQYAADNVSKVELTFKLLTYTGEWKTYRFDYLPR